MQLCWVTLYVSDFEKSLFFYHDVLGLPIHSQHGGGGMEIAMLGTDDQPKVELLHQPGRGEQPLPSGHCVGLRVDSLEDAMAYLKSRDIPVLRGPIAPNPHVRFLFIQDPDGYEVQLVESK